jgi:hypothetical protein
MAPSPFLPLPPFLFWRLLVVVVVVVEAILPTSIPFPIFLIPIYWVGMVVSVAGMFFVPSHPRLLQ